MGVEQRRETQESPADSQHRVDKRRRPRAGRAEIAKAFAGQDDGANQDQWKKLVLRPDPELMSQPEKVGQESPKRDQQKDADPPA